MPLIPAALTLAFGILFQSHAPIHQVAVTFDDLPVISVLPLAPADRASITLGLLTAIQSHHIPAIGFVNENKLLDSAGRIDQDRLSLLRSWLHAGQDLGNHTWSHLDLHRVSLKEFQAEIIKGQLLTARLMAEYHRTPRYFRHPFLHTGTSVAIRDSLNRFLADLGYQVAPVTIDNSDYIFAAAYDRALARGDQAFATRVRTTYLEYMDSVTAFYQRQAVAIVGRDLPQILLLHANRLNADTFDAVASMLERRGYQFVSLAQALEDQAYKSPDHYAGSGGISWLHRWAITAGVSRDVFKGEPEVPAWIATMSQGNR